MTMKNEQDSKPPAIPPLPRASGSASGGTCKDCHHWESAFKDIRIMGYCPVFNKTTHANYGKKCTAFQARYVE